MRRVVAATLIIMGLPAVVNATRAKTLDDLIKDARASGETTKPTIGDKTIAGIPETAVGKELDVDEKEAADGAEHDFVVFLQDDKPLAVVFSAVRSQDRQTEYLNLACDTHGKLKQCYRVAGKDDPGGKPIPGSGEMTTLDAKDKSISAALRHELDFWLKGKYRKPAAKTTAKAS